MLARGSLCRCDRDHRSGEEPRRIAVVRFRNRGVIATAPNWFHIVAAADWSSPWKPCGILLCRHVSHGHLRLMTESWCYAGVGTGSQCGEERVRQAKKQAKKAHLDRRRRADCVGNR